MNEVKRVKKFEKSSNLVTKKTDIGKMKSICSELTQVVADNQMEKLKQQRELTEENSPDWHP